MIMGAVAITEWFGFVFVFIAILSILYGIISLIKWIIQVANKHIPNTISKPQSHEQQPDYKELVEAVIKLQERMNDPTSHEQRPEDWSFRRLCVLKRDGNRCVMCERTTQLHVHHIKPVSVKPNHSLDNLQTLCVYCHAKQPGLGHDRRLIEKAIEYACKQKQYTKRIGRKKYSCQRNIGMGEASYTKYLGKRPLLGYHTIRICENCLLTREDIPSA